jgi:hypothetical protein
MVEEIDSENCTPEAFWQLEEASLRGHRCFLSSLVEIRVKWDLLLLQERLHRWAGYLHETDEPKRQGLH